MHLHASRCCGACLCKKSAHPHVITCLIVRCLSTHWSFPLFRASLHLVQSLHLLHSAHPPCGRNRRVQELAHTQNEEYGPVAIQNPLTGCEPKQLDNFDYTETYTAIFQNESVDIDTEPLYSFDAELDDELIRKALSSPLFTQEREEPANLRHTFITLMRKVCCQLSPFSHAQVRGDPYTNQVQICLFCGNQVATWKTSESGVSLKDKNILQVFTIDFPEIQFYRESQNSQSDGQNKCAKSGMNLRKKIIHINSLVSYFEQHRHWSMKLRSDYRAAVPRIRRTNWRAHPSRSAKTHTTRTKFLRWLPVQRSNWSTYRMAILAFNFKFLVVARIRMVLEVSSHFFLLESLSF